MGMTAREYRDLRKKLERRPILKCAIMAHYGCSGTKRPMPEGDVAEVTPDGLCELQGCYLERDSVIRLMKWLADTFEVDVIFGPE